MERTERRLHRMSMGNFCANSRFVQWTIFSSSDWTCFMNEWIRSRLSSWGHGFYSSAHLSFCDNVWNLHYFDIDRRSNNRHWGKTQWTSQRSNESYWEKSYKSADSKLMNFYQNQSIWLSRLISVILGWSPKIFDIISELVLANENQHNPAIVILALKDRLEMQDLISQRISQNRNTRIICRNGDPMSIRDLNLLSPNSAHSIIILAPLNKNPDVCVIKSILAITNNPQRTKSKFHIVAEIQQRNNIEVARLAGKLIWTLVLRNRGDRWFD